MSGERYESGARRRLVPTGTRAAGRSLYLSAAWTGAGTALICAVVAIAAVAICWLPAAGPAASAGSAIRAGVLTFLAALHGGITVDGVRSAFVPLGLTLLVAAVAWRAGRGLGATAEALDEHDPGRLVRAGLVQAISFGICCAIAARYATLGTSSAPAARSAIAGAVLFAIAGGAGLVRSSALADELAARTPPWLAPAARGAAAAVAVFLAAGAGLVAASLVLHHSRVEALSQHVGGGWSGAPVLLLGVLAAPNAAIAGSSYLAGPGFAVGVGNGVDLGGAAHGTLPAFPLLGALPADGGATAPVWVLAVLTPLLAGAVLCGLSCRAGDGSAQWRTAALGALGAGLAGGVLAWQGGGAIGSGPLAEFGASPWQVGLAFAAEAGVVAVVGLGMLLVIARFRADDPPAAGRLLSTVQAVRSAVGSARTGDDEDAGDDQLAG